MSTPLRDVDGYRHAVDFVPPERIPWSELGPEFVEIWGRPRGKFQPEHVEITGQNGSGKTYILITLLQERALVRGSSEILIVTKEADDTVHRLGWPIVDTWKDLQRYRQAIFWPRTGLQGEEREQYHEQKIYELMTRLWQPGANTVLAFDEIGYVEDLSRRVKKTIRMYWREARSHGVTLVAMKQRPIGVVRDQHSESRWKFVFPPADRGDIVRFAELLGTPRDWAPVLDSLNQENHEFVVRNSVTKQSYISWIDYDIQPIPTQTEKGQPTRTTREYLHGRARHG